MVPPFEDGISLACRIASIGGSASYVESVCQSVARFTPYQSTLPSASTLVSQDTSGYSALRYLTIACMRGEPNQRPNAASSAAPRFWSRNTSTGCSANTRPIQAKVASSSGLERSIPNASVPSSSPSERSWGELVMGGPPTLSPERCDRGTGTIIALRAVCGENRKRWVSVSLSAHHRVSGALSSSPQRATVSAIRQRWGGLRRQCGLEHEPPRARLP